MTIVIAEWKFLSIYRTIDIIAQHYLARRFVPISGRGLTEQENIRHSVQERQINHPPAVPPTITWPRTSATPINEFNTEGYISCAFPTLFPTGAADLLAPRIYEVTVGNYFKHLMMYKDGRFAKHPRFRYLALNTEMRWRALQTGGIYVRQHHQDAQLSLDDFVPWLDVRGKHFPTECFTMLPVCVEQDSIGIDSEVASLPWWTHLECPPYSSLTMQLISSGQSLHSSPVETILNRVAAAAKHSRRIQPIQIGSSTIELKNLLKPFTSVSLVLLTTGCTSSGSIEVVLMCMALPGCQVHLMQRRF